MKFWLFFLFFNLIFPALMILMGIYFYRRRNSKITIYSGYRTVMSMKNNETWKFAHEYSGKLFKNLGISAFVITLFIHLGFINSKKNIIFTEAIIMYIVQMIIIILSLLLIEFQLKKNFDQDGNRINH